jgi:hypothetical protein
MTGRTVKERLGGFGLATALAMSIASVGILQALADTTPPSGTPATVSAEVLPTWQINGVVWSQVIVGNTVYVTGSFTRARPPNVAAGGPGEVAANNLFAYDITNGNRVTSFNHSLNAQGRAITRSPDGSRIYVGGDFTTVNGSARGHLAAFWTSTNALDSSFRPSVSGPIRAVTASNSTVYFGGAFTRVNGATRKNLGAVGASDGSVRGWAPTADDNAVWSMVLAPAQDRVIVGGAFSTLNRSSAVGMGSVDATTGTTNLPWAANKTIRDSGVDGAITSLRTDGVQIFGSGYSYHSGSTPNNFEGTFAAAPSTGAISVVNDCHGDTYDVLPLGQVLYSAGHAHDCSWVGSFPDTNPRVRWQRGMAQTVAPKTVNRGPDSYGWNFSGLPASAVLHWFPDFSTGNYTGAYQGPWSLAGNGTYLAVGGEFLKVNGKAQQGLARMAVRSTAPNKMGPTYSTTPSRPVPSTTASRSGSGSVTITFGTAWDRDNSTLTYTLYRNGTTPVKSAQYSTNFWTLPTKSLTDTGLTPGSTYFYKVRVTDPFGNTLWSPQSNNVTV